MGAGIAGGCGASSEGGDAASADGDKAEPTKAEPTKAEPAKAEPVSGRDGKQAGGEAKPKPPVAKAPDKPAAGSEPSEPIASDPAKPAPRTIAQLGELEPTLLAPPPWKREAVAAVAITTGAEPSLKQLSKKRNKITDDDAWWASHGVTLPRYVSPKGAAARGVAVTLPPQVPLEYRGKKLMLGLEGDDHDVFIYGAGYGEERYAVVADDKLNVVAFFDFKDWAVAPDTDPAELGFAQQGVQWATVSDGVLFVATGYNGYSSYAKGKNAFLSAIKLVSGELLWQSEPLVATALSNFILRDGWILSGYGFTKEDDFLFAIRATDGSVAKKVKIKSGPRALVIKDDKLLVRTYDTDYEFAL